MSKLTLAFSGLFVAVSCYATQNIDLKSGASVVLDKLADTTVVTCENQNPVPVTPKCICSYRFEQRNNSTYYDLKLYPQQVVLDTFYRYRDTCLKAESTYLECK